MNFIKKYFFIFIIVLFMLPALCFCDEKSQEPLSEKTIEREEYIVKIKQYKQEYPLILYVVFKESVPLLNSITKILKTEILTLANTEKPKTDIIASAWFDDQISDKLEKIELTKTYGAFVWISDEKERKIVNFNEYLKYLKKKKEEDKNKEKQNTNSGDKN